MTTSSLNPQPTCGTCGRVYDSELSLRFCCTDLDDDDEQGYQPFYRAYN